MSKMSGTDAEWIEAAYQVLAPTTQAMHVKEIEEKIRTQQLVSQSPSMPLEVLLTKEAAMGRQFTKAENSTSGFFSLLPPSVSARPPPLPIEIDFSLPPNSDKVSPVDERPPSPSHGYRIKYVQLKKTCKQMIYLNAALYDEIARMERKIERATAERRTLLLKLMADQNIPLPTAPIVDDNDKPDNSGASKESAKRKDPSSALSTVAKKLKSGADAAGKSKKSEQGSSTKSSGKKSKNVTKSILIPSINLDGNGRPVLPLQLPGGLTVHSLGEVNDKPGFCRTECIYPVGYCCTRQYASPNDIHKKSLYTCKISETPNGPQFEISSDKDPNQVFVDMKTPEDCHGQLVDFFKQTLIPDLQMTKHSDFFGLKSPIIKNLLQCSPGAQNCLEYSWCRFQVVRNTSKTSATPSTKDPATTFKALHKFLGSSGASDSRSDESDE